jgi:outer membrane receptor protein involved in Fe transport
MLRIAVIGLAGLSLSTARTTSAQQTGRVSGTVRAASDSTPVADATVIARGSRRATQTDGSGRFVLAGLAAGREIISVQRMGFAAVTDTVEVVATGTTTLDFLMRHSAQVIAPMVVSATRETQRRTDASATIDVIGGAEMRESRAAHPAAIVKRIPGVHISQLSGEGHSTAIRQPISTKPLYLYLEDGVPTRSTGFFNHNALYEVNLPQAGGLEVLKGPGTALYGSDAIGGVVNALTRPAPLTPSLDLSTELGDYGYRRLLGTGGFTSGSHGLRVDLNLTRADGFKQDAPYDRKSGTVRHDLVAGNVSLRTVVTATHVDQHDVFALDGASFAAAPDLNRSPIAFRDVSAIRWSTAIEREKGTSLASLTPFVRHNVLRLIPNWQLTFNPEIWDTRNDSYGALLKYRRDFTPMRLRVIVGADLDVSPGSVRYDGIVTSRTGPDSGWHSYTVGAPHYDYDVTYRQISPYAHAEFSPVPRVRVDAGLRFDRSSYDYTTNLPVIQTGRWRVPGDTTLEFSHVSPKVGVTVDVRPGLNLYGSVREGFRAPAQGQLFQQGSNLNTTGLDPVTVASVEFGARGSLGSRVIYTVAWYDMRVKNDILSILDAQGISTSSNAGETSHRGIEAALGAAVTPDLRLDLAWSRSTQRYVDWVIPVGGQNRSYAGNTIEQAPQSLGNALLSWAPGWLNGGRLAAEWSHTGKYYMDPENTHTYRGFELWTFHASHIMPRIGEVFARVTNATNEKYAELVSYNAFNREQYTPGNPRMFFAGVRWMAFGGNE